MPTLAEERAAKYDAVAQRWTAQPDIAPCIRGEKRVWYIEQGRDYTRQLYCKHRQMHIDPSGRQCAHCADDVVSTQATTERIDLRGCEPCKAALLDAMKSAQ